MTGNGSRSALPTVSVVIIAQDEEANIEACLSSARWADETVVVDGGSQDRTVEIAASMGARVHHNPWPGFSAQWDLAISLASGDWVFMLAADERVTADLAGQAREAIASPSACDGYYVRRRTSFLDRPMRGCGWGDQRELRLFRRGRGRMDGRLVHERLVVEGRLGELPGLLLHFSHPTVSDYLDNLNRCTTLEAEEALALGLHASWLPPVAPLLRATRRWLAGDRSSLSARAALKDELKNRHAWAPLQPFAPLLRFLQMYALQRGYRDGRHGLFLSLLSAVYVFVTQVKRWELRRSRGEAAREQRGKGNAMADNEVEVLRGYARRSAEMGNQHVSNLSNRYSIFDYCLMADEVRQAAGPGALRLLDWGCGYGHMSYLLRRRGFEVTGLTVPDENNVSDSWNLLAREEGIDVVVSDDDIRLPFDDDSFDVVLSCGVLEHVPDEAASVREIARVLRPGGLFLVYQLPNWLSVTEWLSERLLGVAHERRYRLGEVRGLLAQGGLTVRSRRHGSMVPKNLDRLPFLRPLFDHRYRLVAKLDAALLRVPVINWFSGTWEIVAEKPPEAPAGRPRAVVRGAPALIEAGSDGAHRR